MILAGYYLNKAILKKKDCYKLPLPKKKIKQMIIEKTTHPKKLLPVFFRVSYIISISFARSNTFLTVSKSDGSLCLSFNAGDLGFSGKKKKN